MQRCVDEVRNVVVELFPAGIEKAMWLPCIDYVVAIWNEPGRAVTTGGNRHGLVFIAMYDERGHIYGGHILPEVRL